MHIVFPFNAKYLTGNKCCWRTSWTFFFLIMLFYSGHAPSLLLPVVTTFNKEEKAFLQCNRLSWSLDQVLVAAQQVHDDTVSMSRQIMVPAEVATMGHIPPSLSAPQLPIMNPRGKSHDPSMPPIIAWQVVAIIFMFSPGVRPLWPIHLQLQCCVAALREEFCAHR